MMCSNMAGILGVKKDSLCIQPTHYKRIPVSLVLFCGQIPPFITLQQGISQLGQEFSR